MPQMCMLKSSNVGLSPQKICFCLVAWITVQQEIPCSLNGFHLKGWKTRWQKETPPKATQPPIVHNDVKYMSVILVHLHDSSTPRGSARMGFGGSVFECWCPHSRLASFECSCKTCKCDVWRDDCGMRLRSVAVCSGITAQLAVVMYISRAGSGSGNSPCSLAQLFF